MKRKKSNLIRLQLCSPKGIFGEELLQLAPVQMILLATIISDHLEDSILAWSTTDQSLRFSRHSKVIAISLGIWWNQFKDRKE